MSEICLQFGQCGNQLGSHFFQTIHETDSRCSRWFNSTEKRDVARCILVDTENKVVSMLLNNSNKNWQYSRGNCVFSKGGCGNNWAFGYFYKGPEMLDKILEMIRVEIEKCDNVRSIIGFMGSGGGTGSGVGSYILENLRDTFPHKSIISSLVISLCNKESPIEFYNTVLSISKLHKFCDVLMTFYNDSLFKQCSIILNNREFRYDELNFIISNQLASLLKSFNVSTFSEDYMAPMISHPMYKILSFKSCPYILPNITYETNVNWESLLKYLRAALIKADNEFREFHNFLKVHSFSRIKVMELHKSVANMVICNGKASQSARHLAEKYFQVDEMYVPWVSKCDRFIYLTDDRPIVRYPFATLISNGGVFNNRFEKIIDYAWKSFHKNAYIHHFEQYGLQKEDFLLEFLNVENVAHAYKAL